MKYIIIACVNKSNSLGLNGELLYKIKKDLLNFKRMTTNNVVIMGKNTYDSLPIKPLKNRINIVITNKDGCDEKENLYFVNSVESAINLCERFFLDKEIFIIGGGMIYKEFINLATEMRLTIVNDDTKGDTFFPKFNENEWYTYYETLEQTEGNLSFIFKILKRK